MLTKTKRPKHLNLLKIRLPATGVASILHRISGVILFLSIPFFIYLLALSLRNAEGFAEALRCLQNTGIKLLGLAFIWSLAHHFFAGLRFLLLDLHIGLSLKSAKASAWLVIFLGVAVFLLALLGVMI